MHNKAKYIAPRLQRLLGLAEPPLVAIKAFRESPANFPVLFATSVLGFGIAGLNSGILWFAWHSFESVATMCLAAFATILLVCVVAAQLMTARAMKGVGVL